MILTKNIDSIFLDRDGVINIDEGYTYKWSQFEFIEGVIEALQHLKNLGKNLIIVTNQSGIARGYYTEKDYLQLEAMMLNEMKSFGIDILDVYHCPHHIDGIVPSLSIPCSHRKPSPGMILSAIRDHDLDPLRSIIIGDKESDIEAGENAKLAGKYLINSNHHIHEFRSTADAVYKSLNDLVKNAFELKND
jgi:D-glycero-D-manno-heptose 1,7-bisphosphate phosphatase